PRWIFPTLCAWLPPIISLSPPEPGRSYRRSARAFARLFPPRRQQLFLVPWHVRNRLVPTGIESVSVSTSAVSALSIPARSCEGRNPVRRHTSVSAFDYAGPDGRSTAPLLGLCRSDHQGRLACQPSWS